MVKQERTTTTKSSGKKKSKLTFLLLKELPKPEMNPESLKNQSRDPEVKKNVGIF